MTLQGKSIVVTGGTGLIGSALIPRLAADGARVRVLSRRGRDAAGLPEGATVERADVTRPETLDFGGADAVVHAAAWVGFGLPKGKRDLLWRTNVDGTRNVLDAAARAGVPRVLHVSSVAAIGATPAGLYNEDHVWDRAPYFRSLYERSKYEAHVLAMQRNDLDVVAVMPSVVLGLGDHGSGVLLQSFLSRRIPAVPTGDNPTGFVHLDDVVEGIRLALQKGDGAYVLNDQNLTLVELFRLLEEATGVAAPRRRVGLRTVRLLARVAETGAHLLRTTPPISREIVESLELPLTYDSTRARKELGWRPELAAGAARDAERYRAGRR